MWPPRAYMHVEVAPIYAATTAHVSRDMQPFDILNIDLAWVLEPESLGSKRKFWFRPPMGKKLWLFKYSEANTGQHWAEKVAEQIAEALVIPTPSSRSQKREAKSAQRVSRLFQRGGASFMATRF